MHKKRGSASPPLLSLHGVEYQTEAGRKITASGREILAQVKELARCNGWRWQDLLSNKALAPGELLTCKLVEHLPAGWLQDSSGYLMMRFRSSCLPRGHSFEGEATADKDGDYEPAARRSCKRAAHSAQANGSDEDGGLHTPTRRPQRQRTSSSASYTAYLQPSPPSSAQIGASQPMLERYHRVLFAACMSTDQLQDGLVLHACGNRKCAVIAHLYLGDVGTNSMDTRYHAKRRQCSRTNLPKLQ